MMKGDMWEKPQISQHIIESSAFSIPSRFVSKSLKLHSNRDERISEVFFTEVHSPGIFQHSHLLPF